jgi:cytochrome c5
MRKITGSVAARATLPALLVLVGLGSWSPPVDAANRVREGKQVVDAACAACHLEGKDGAPKIGDRAAWTPRLSRGLDALVDAAVNGHGGMPSRGGMPQLEREELRGAILYMFNFGLPPAASPPLQAAAADPRHKLVAGTDVYFGVMRAEAIRVAQRNAARGGMTPVNIPSGKDYYHLNISLADHRDGAALKDAQVTLRVSDGMAVQEKTLRPVAANQAVSWGNFFRLTSGSAYSIRAEIQRPGLARAIVTDFDYKAP